MKQHIDIVIPIHKAAEELSECILALQKYTKDYRVIFVDDFSCDPKVTEAIDWFQQQEPSTMVVRTGKQKWFTRASNSGLRLVRTERAVLLNSDCVPQEGWLEELEWCWEDIQKTTGKPVGVVGSVWILEETRRWAETFEPNYPTGHCLLLDMKAIQQASEVRQHSGWFLDEVHDECCHINSDRYLAYELNRLGYATAVSYKAQVHHKGGRSWHHNLDWVAKSIPHVSVLD